MDPEAEISGEVRDLITDIIKSNNFRSSLKIKYSPGSEAGDGYTAKTVAVDIVDGDKSLQLFIKYTRNFNESSRMNLTFVHETLFYQTILPTYLNFLEEKGVNDGFRNVPKCYGCCEKKCREAIAFENLKAKGYTLFNRYEHLNSQQLELILRTFAKFHAISFALKDQRRELHDKFCDAVPYVYTYLTGFENIFGRLVGEFVSKLDPLEDKDILQKCKDLESRVVEEILQTPNRLSKYSILTKFDCWINNTMVLFEDEKKIQAKDVMLIDWQCITRASPIHDIGTIFYSTASKDSIDNYKHYMQVYHDELSNRIRELGSNPDIVYPYSVFEKEWIYYGFYCFGFGITAIRGMLARPESAPDISERINTDNKEMLYSTFSDIPDNVDEWISRGRYLARHFISLGVL